MDTYLGSIECFAFNFAPRGYLMCNGQTMQIAQNQALFALLSNAYGGDGRTTFMLPDTRGRRLIGYGTNTSINKTYTLGAVGGSPSYTLTLANIPTHTHSAVLAVSSSAQTQSDPTNNYPGTASSSNNVAIYGPVTPTTVAMGPAKAPVLNSTGSGTPVSLLNPGTVMNYCIAVSGLFPPRNY